MNLTDHQYKHEIRNTLAPALALVIKKGDIDRINALFKIGADVNARGSRNSHSEHFTPLYWACSKGHAEITRLLLDRGAKLEVKNDYGTALYWACEHGHVEIARILLEAGARVNFPKASALLPLSGACKSKDPYLVRLLLDHGADVNARDYPCLNSPLHFVCTAEIARLLLDAGADINARNKSDDAPIHTAAHAARTDVVQFFVNNGVDPDCRGYIGTTALHYASEKGSVETVQLLLDHGADPNARNSIGHDSFDHATRNGIIVDNLHVAVIPILLNHGAEPPEDKLERVFEIAVHMNQPDPNRDAILEWFQQNRPEMYFSKFCTVSMAPGGM